MTRHTDTDHSAAAATELIAAAEDALAGMRKALRADGYDLVLALGEGGGLVVSVEAGPGACAGCLIPPAGLLGVMKSALSSAALDLDIELHYPDGSPAT